MNDRLRTIAFRLLRYLLRVLLMGACAGGIVYLAAFGFRFDADAAGWSVVIGSLYVAIMTGGQLLSARFADRHLAFDSRRMVVVRVLLHALAMALSFILATFLTRYLLGLDLMGMGGMLLVISLVAIPGTIIGNTIYYLEAFHQRARAAEQAAVRSELEALRAKVNPHFLFNSLNSIAALIRIDPEKAEIVTQSLADLFRYSLRASTRPVVTLADEIESIELYLTIERARFGDRLRVTLDVPSELLEAELPGLLLQPLVENGVKHGAGRTTEGCGITISARLDAGELQLSVRDTGPGFDSTDPDMVMKRGTGLANVADRLRHQFGVLGRLIIIGNGVELRFPFQPSNSHQPEMLHDSLYHR